MNEVTCPSCEGSGIDARMLDEDLVVQCPRCEGYGTIEEEMKT